LIKDGKAIKYEGVIGPVSFDGTVIMLGLSYSPFGEVQLVK
jgi:hypothetical protein